MKTNLTMSLWKSNQVLLILKTLSINVLIRPILYLSYIKRSYEIWLGKWCKIQELYPHTHYRYIDYHSQCNTIFTYPKMRVQFRIDNLVNVELRSLSGSIHSTIYVSIHDFIFIQGGRVSVGERMASSLFCATTAAHYVIYDLLHSTGQNFTAAQRERAQEDFKVLFKGAPPHPSSHSHTKDSHSTGITLRHTSM